MCVGVYACVCVCLCVFCVREFPLTFVHGGMVLVGLFVSLYIGLQRWPFYHWELFVSNLL